MTDLRAAEGLSYGLDAMICRDAQALLRRRDERAEAEHVTSTHFFFAVAAPNLYVPPVVAIISTIFIHGILSGFCFVEREGCVTSSLSNSSCT